MFSEHKHSLPYDSASPSLGLTQEKRKAMSIPRQPNFTVASFVTASNWKQLNLGHKENVLANCGVSVLRNTIQS